MDAMRTALIAAVLGLAQFAGTSLAQAPKAPARPGNLPPAAKGAPAKGPATSQPSAPPTAKAAPPAAAPAGKGQADRSQDERAIRQTADDFAKAYNAHDAQAIAKLFAPDGELASEEGDVQQGRDEIAEEFAAVFEQFPEAKIKIEIRSVRFLTPNVAVEDGTASVVRTPGDAATPTRYTVIHSKQDGRWQIASTRDYSAGEDLGVEELAQLNWLEGEWVDESPDAMVMTKYSWTDNHRYLLSEFTIQVGGRGVMTGSSRMGWDALNKVIRSWVFDSEGGFTEGNYARDGDRWIIKMTGVTRDGKAASATNIVTRLSKDRMTWESRDRVVDGEVEPDIEPVLVVRKPPAPISQAASASK
jgi:uncharacterized protein (TIGR02246 family)